MLLAEGGELACGRLDARGVALQALLGLGQLVGGGEDLGFEFLRLLFEGDAMRVATRDELAELVHLPLEAATLRHGLFVVGLVLQEGLFGRGKLLAACFEALIEIFELAGPRGNFFEQGGKRLLAGGNVAAERGEALLDGVNVVVGDAEILLAAGDCFFVLAELFRGLADLILKRGVL